MSLTHRIDHEHSSLGSYERWRDEATLSVHPYNGRVIILVDEVAALQVALRDAQQQASFEAQAAYQEGWHAAMKYNAETIGKDNERLRQQVADLQPKLEITYATIDLLGEAIKALDSGDG